MIHRRRNQQSLKVGFCEAVSDLALIRGWDLFVFSLSGAENPQIIGNAEGLPFLSEAMTGAMSVGRTSPSVLTGRPRSWTILEARDEFRACSMIGLSSGDISTKYLLHMNGILSNSADSTHVIKRDTLTVYDDFMQICSFYSS